MASLDHNEFQFGEKYSSVMKQNPLNIFSFNNNFYVNSLAPERCSSKLKLVNFKLKSRIGILSISNEIALLWMPQDLTED